MIRMILIATLAIAAAAEQHHEARECADLGPHRAACMDATGLPQ